MSHRGQRWCTPGVTGGWWLCRNARRTHSQPPEVACRVLAWSVTEGEEHRQRRTQVVMSRRKKSLFFLGGSPGPTELSFTSRPPKAFFLQQTWKNRLSRERGSEDPRPQAQEGRGALPLSPWWWLDSAHGPWQTRDTRRPPQDGSLFTGFHSFALGLLFSF